MLGNPRGLYKKMSTGVHDFFYEPLAGLLEGPDKFRSGVLKGGRSFNENVLQGVGESVHKVTASLAKGMAELTHDADYLAGRQGKSTAIMRQAAKRPENAAEGLLQGADTVAQGLARGFGGLFSKPLKGAKEKGVEGFFHGLGQGAVGLVVKPLVGVTDAVSEGLQRTSQADLKSGVFAQRARLPRALGQSAELLSYSVEEAEVQQQLWLVVQAGGKKYRNLAEGRYCAGRRCGALKHHGAKRLVVTTIHVISLHVGHAGGAAGSSGGIVGGASASELQLEWYEALTNVATAEETGGELVLHLRDGGMRFVPCAGGTRERRACFDIVDRALKNVVLHAGS